MEKERSIDSKLVSIIVFFISILLFFIIVIPGENMWYAAHKFLLGIFGISSLLLPVVMFFINISYMQGKFGKYFKVKCGFIIAIVCLFYACMYVCSNQFFDNDENFFGKLIELYNNGIFGTGLFSGFVGIPLIYLTGIVGARIISIISLCALLMITMDKSLTDVCKYVREVVRTIKKRFEQDKKTIDKDNKSNKIINETNNKVPRIDTDLEKKRINRSRKIDIDISVDPSEEEVESSRVDDFYKNIEVKSKKLKKNKEFELKENENEYGYVYPPIDLMEESVEIEEQDIKTELQQNGQMLVDVLESFGVKTKIVDISRGPTVTRYELQPASGVKISKITGLSDDIALNLAAAGVRIEAPIPGKAAVGVEIPNKLTSVVRMRELISSEEFINAKSKLTVVLGLDISGNVAIADLSKMPHLLIAGSTGSGKSVCINSFIISLLYKSSPEEVRLLMIDPKVVELGVYNGIPHLLVPVVTDPKKASGALNWAVNEMLNRYKLFADNNVRDIKSYNKLFEKGKIINEGEEEVKPLPQIVIIIDELADLMMVAPNEVEDSICRLAQMARAAGMHLVIATQRPSVDVITGIIKANIPSRVALAVSSSIDSRTILDMSGAEKLLGRGDMLFSPIGSQKPIRIQGSFVTDEEIERVIDFIKVKTSDEALYDRTIIDEIDRNAMKKDSNKDNDDKDEDPMLKEAIKCVVEAGQASTSLLQRKLRLGYARAGRLIDQMEQMGIVGPHEGSKPRQVIITYNQWLEMNMMKDE